MVWKWGKAKGIFKKFPKLFECDQPYQKRLTFILTFKKHLYNSIPWMNPAMTEIILKGFKV